MNTHFDNPITLLESENVSPRKITASPETLVRQAGYTAEEYLNAAIKGIDEIYGKEGYAKSHPELVSSYMLTSALDYMASSIQIHSQNIAEVIETLGNEY